MQTISNLTTDDLKQLIKDSVKETLSEKKLKDIFHEVIEDVALAKAINEGMNTETIDKNRFLKKLKSRIQ
jgi:hypothetical protein